MSERQTEASGAVNPEYDWLCPNCGYNYTTISHELICKQEDAEED